jgi:hypothetical protein
MPLGFNALPPESPGLRVGFRRPARFRPLSRRSGRIPALPYPPPRCSQLISSIADPFCMYYGSEFVNEAMIQYCLRNGIELTRSRPYRKNDQAWIEQKNGAIVRKLLGYRRFEGIAAAHAMGCLYGASRLFVNFFQPSFKLAENTSMVRR